MDPSSALYLLDKVWLFPAIMAGSFLIILFVGKRLPERGTSAIGIAAVGVCFLMSLLVGAQWINRVNHPPAGAEMAAAQVACGVPPTGEGSGTEAGGAEAPTEHALAPVGVAEGESASAMPPNASEGQTEAPASGSGEATTTSAEGEGHGEVEVVPVCKSVSWFKWGAIDFQAGTLLDGLAAMMLFTVTLISLLVHIYSKEYLHEDRRFTHYYAFLSLFTASMLFYVMSNNTLQMLVGWELVGLCSFALIGHWWEEKANTNAALKAFLTNRVGDTGLIIGVIITFFAAGGISFNVFHINEYALSPGANTALLLVGGLCLFGGVTSKSGQFPLHTWLPDAMAGPTPVSALIHAATMVVAGVYLVARMYPVFFAGMHIGSGSINYVAIAGGLTTLVGASLAFVQHDIKKVLAYSTISQLGYMILGLGVGAWTGATFHLFTHAMFKACLFLCAGSVSHACHHTFDMREMGGLKKYMPITRWCFIIAGAALAGLPFMSGFWSKDEILAGALNNGYPLVFAMGVITAFMTAAYTLRAYWLTFEGDYKGHAHPHESPKLITVPLMILAAMAFVVTLLNIPNFGNWTEGSALASVATRFEHYVQPTFAFPVPGPASAGDLPVVTFTIWLALASVVIALAGLAVMYLYVAKGAFKGLTEKVPVLGWGYRVLVEKYYLDYLYTDIIVGGIKRPIANAAYWTNMNIIDPIVWGTGVVARMVGGFVYRFIDQGIVDRIVNTSGLASNETGQFLRRGQTGKVQQYASLLFGSAVVFVICLVLAVR